ncbi:MAG: hypothetical protein AAGU05_08870, partial [Anaerolineaceae bacterium]
MSYQKRIFTWVGVFVFLILVYLLVVARYMNPILSQNTNTLAIGRNYVVDSLNIPITDPVELDGLTRDQVYALRQEAVMEYPWLLYTTYQPSRSVFDSLEDGLSWWGIPGWYYYGKGDHSASGLSKEAMLLLNPYVLLSAEFTGLSTNTRQTKSAFWNESLINEAVLAKESFPFTLQPENLRWWPERARVEVTYNLSRYLAAVNYYTVQTYRPADVTFDLIGYNARDLNLNYIWVQYDQSLNISREIYPGEIIQISHHLQHNNDCG